jgi:hypothetical protein
MPCINSHQQFECMIWNYIREYHIIINNIDHYHFVSEIHNRDTRQGFNLNLYHPPVHLSLYQRCSYCMGIKTFNSLPLKLKHLYKDVKHFKLALKSFLCCHSFYTLTQYFEIVIGRIKFDSGIVCMFCLDAIYVDVVRLYCCPFIQTSRGCSLW